MASLMDEYPMPGMEIDPRELEKAKYLALMRMGLGMASKEPLGRAVQGGINTYFAGDEAARRNADQKMQERRAHMQYAMGMKKDALEAKYQSGLPQAFESAKSRFDKYMALSDYASQHGRSDEAKRFADIAKLNRTEYNNKSETMKTLDGKIVAVQLSDTGDPKILDLLPADKLHFANTNTQAGVGLNPYTGEQVSQGVAQNISPADVQRIGLDQARLGIERQRLAESQAGPIMETADGPMRVSNKNVATPITTADGNTLGPKPSAGMAQQIAENNVAMNGMREVIKHTLDRPKSFGADNYLGHEMQQRMDPKGTLGRAAVAALGSKKIHDLSGANVTAAESPRLKPHIPAVTDTARTIRIMTERMLKETELMQQELMRGKSLKEVINAPSITTTVPIGAESKITGLTKTGYDSLQQNYDALAAQLKKDDEERARLGR